MTEAGSQELSTNAEDSAVKDVEVITFPVVSDEQDAADYAGGASASFFVNKNHRYTGRVRRFRNVYF